MGYHRRLDIAGQLFLWRYRTLLTDPLRFDPQYVVDGWSQRSRKRTENVTPRIPEQVLGPLSAWSLRFVDDFAPDILTVMDDSGPLRPSSANGKLGRNADATAALAAVLDDYITAGRPLPGTRRGANRAVLAAEAGISSIRRPDHQALIRAAEQTVGVDPYTWVPITISGQLDGRQWTDGISANHQPTMSVKVLSRMLLTACYVLVAYLSGMRESEVKHLRRGCVAVRRTPDGTPYRWTVTGTAFKGASDPNGVEATWTVGAPIARAIEVLERLVRPDADLLCTFLTGSTGDTSRKTGPNQVFTTTATNMQLNDLCAWINSYCAAHGRSDHIQRVDGAPWVLTTWQFRRTLAWFIARRPGGSVAGVIAYRHLSIHVFEGYAGTSASGFRAEVEAEQAILRGENLMAMIDQHEHTQLAGPAAKEAAARLAEFAQGVQFTGAVPTDPQRIKRLLSKSGGSIYPGKYSACVFDARKALCLNGPAAGDAEPRLDHCQPLSCTNVALTRENVAHWPPRRPHSTSPSRSGPHSHQCCTANSPTDAIGSSSSSTDTPRITRDHPHRPAHPPRKCQLRSPSYSTTQRNSACDQACWP